MQIKGALTWTLQDTTSTKLFYYNELHLILLKFGGNMSCTYFLLGFKFIPSYIPIRKSWVYFVYCLRPPLNVLMKNDQQVRKLEAKVSLNGIEIWIWVRSWLWTSIYEDLRIWKIDDERYSYCVFNFLTKKIGNQFFPLLFCQVVYTYFTEITEIKALN